MRAHNCALIAAGEILLHDGCQVLQEIVRAKLGLPAALVGAAAFGRAMARARELFRTLGCLKSFQMLGGHVILKKLGGARLVITMLTLMLEGACVLCADVHMDCRL